MDVVKTILSTAWRGSSETTLFTIRSFTFTVNANESGLTKSTPASLTKYTLYTFYSTKTIFSSNKAEK